MSKIWLIALVVAVGAAIYFVFSPPAIRLSDAGVQHLFALVDYRSLTGKEDGVAILDVTPGTKEFGTILQTMPIGVGVLPHHPYYNRDHTTIYTTALGGEHLYKLEFAGMRIKKISPIQSPTCIVGEDLYFSQDRSKFYQTCMGSDRVVAYDAKTDTPIQDFRAARPAPTDLANYKKVAVTDPATMQSLGDIDFPSIPFIRWPHGISVNELIDRMVVTETIKPDLSEPGSSVTVIRASTGDVLQTIPIVRKPGTASSPVEVLFYQGSPLAYVTAMGDASLWTLAWNPDDQSFSPQLVDAGEARGQSWPLEPMIGPNGHLFVSWAKPGVVNEYSVDDPAHPKFIRTLPADAGAHHMDFSPDGHYLFVQNNLLNLDGLNAGTITVVDLQTGQKVGTIKSLLNAGLMPESLILLKSGMPGMKM
jgi:hypothetical protein